MRALLAVGSVAVLLAIVSTVISQEPPTGGARAFSRNQRPPTPSAGEPQRPGRSIAIEVVVVDVTGEADGEPNAELLAELEKAGKLASLSRLRLSALENSPAVVQFGERVSVVTGRTSFQGGRGGVQDMLSQENLGTLVNVTARVDRDDSVLMEFQAEMTRLASPPPRGENEPGDRSADFPRTTTITAHATLRIPPGKMVLAGSKSTQTEQGTRQTWILVSATAGAVSSEPDAVLKIVPLKHAQAEAMAALLSALRRGEEYRAAVDERTNSLIISASPAALERIIPLVAELDRPAEE